MPNKTISNILRLVVAFAISGILLFWVYRKVNMADIEKAMSADFAYGFVILSVVLGILAHIVRSLRWQIIVSETKPLTLAAGMISVFSANFGNVLFPRLGEVWRSAITARAAHIPFAKVFGALVVERVVDISMLFILSTTAFMVQPEDVIKFATENKLIDNMYHKFHLEFWWIIALIGLLGIGVYIYLKKTHRTLIPRRQLNQFKSGFQTIFRMKNRKRYLLLAVLSWFLYFATNSVVFWAFSFTSHLGISVALFVFVMGSAGMAAPVQGGIGSYHIMTALPLIYFGVSQPDAAVFALVAHSATTIMVIVTGLIATILTPVFIKRKRSNV